MTDYKTVKEWFQQCRDGAAAVKAQKQKIQRIRDAAEKCTQSLNGMPTGEVPVIRSEMPLPGWIQRNGS